MYGKLPPSLVWQLFILRYFLLTPYNLYHHPDLHRSELDKLLSLTIKWKSIRGLYGKWLAGLFVTLGKNKYRQQKSRRLLLRLWIRLYFIDFICDTRYRVIFKDSDKYEVASDDTWSHRSNWLHNDFNQQERAEILDPLTAPAYHQGGGPSTS